VNKTKEHLGDAACAAIQSDRLILTGPDSVGATRTIAIEPKILAALLTYLGLRQQ
jgi:hypothetical protein